jgi:hypothetical protein
LLFVVGYFGCKLQSLEGVAVAQLAALLLATLKDMGPTYVGLKNLSYTLGIAVLSRDKYYHEDTSVPANLRTIIPSSSPATRINFALIVIVVPVLAGLVFKILSVTCCKQSRRSRRAWKYSLGTFTYYGLLFLAYGELACLTVSLKYFQSNLEGGMAVLAGVVFTIILVVSVIASVAAPAWYGCFRKKFIKFELASHFYVFSSAERMVTATVIVFLSPGMIAAGFVAVPLLAEAILIVVKRPYVLG